jgi:hypothetical protein
MMFLSGLTCYPLLMAWELVLLWVCGGLLVREEIHAIGQWAPWVSATLDFIATFFYAACGGGRR